MMEKSQNTALLYSLQDYIGAFRILDALPYSAIRPEHVAENGGYPPTQNGDIRSLFWLFSLMALQN